MTEQATDGHDGCMSNVTVEELSEDAGRAMFAREVSDGLGITRQEFLDRLDPGDGQDDETVFRLRMLAPFGR